MITLMHLPKPSITDRVVDVLWPIMAFAPLFLVLLPMSLAGADPKPMAVASAGLGDWQANPQAALQAVLADNQKLLQALQDLVDSKKTDWLAWGVGITGVLIGFVKTFNGPAGALAESLWAGIAPKIVKDAEKKRDIMADGFLQVAAIMRSFPANTPLGEVIDKLDRRLPESVKTAYREWEAHEADDRPAPVPPASVVDTLVKNA